VKRLVFGLTILGLVTSAGAVPVLELNGRHLQFYPTRHAAGPGAGKKAANISYHNGPVIRQAKVVSIFWGPSATWGTNGSPSALAQAMIDFTGQFGTTPQYNVITQYYDSTGSVQLSNLGTTYWIDNTTPPTSVTFFGDYPSQSGSTIVTKGQAWDIGGGVASVQVKIQRLDAGVLTDATAYSSATPDDGTFSSPVESFSHTTGLLSFPNGTPVQVSVKVTDTSGNVNTFTGPLVGNNGAWSTSPVNSSDTVPPTLAVTGCVDPLTGAVAGGCGVNTSETTPSGANSVIFSAFASDDVAVAGAEYAVTKPTSGDTVIGWSPCVAADGAFGGKLETVSCTVTFPSAATP